MTYIFMILFPSFEKMRFAFVGVVNRKTITMKMSLRKILRKKVRASLQEVML